MIHIRHEDKQHMRVGSLADQLLAGLDPLPFIVEIHPTDICPHKCDYCYHGGNGYDLKRAKEVLSLNQYYSLFVEMKKLGIPELSISGGGEPTADKRLTSIINAAFAESLCVRLVTNGNNFENNLFESLLYCQEVRFSIDAATPETYNKIRHVPGDYLFKTLENIGTLVKMRSLKAKNELRIGATFLINKVNYEETLPFINMVEQLGVDSIIVKHDIYDLQTVDPEKLSNVITKVENLKMGKLEFRDKINMDPSGKPCYTPYFKVSFNPYGEFYSCCLGSQPGEKNGYLFGSLKTDSLEQIWEKSMQIRKNMAKGVVCINCNYTDSLLNAEVSHDISNRS